MSYILAVSTADGSAEQIELHYASQEVEDDTEDREYIEITEGGTYTATVDGTAYYIVAVNESCKVTVSLAGEANLTVAEFTQSGESWTDVENNILVIEETFGTWIYFAISSDTAGDYQFTVTIE